MTVAPFPEWRPDVSDFRGTSSLTIQNVLPRGDGYGPFPDFQALTSALPSFCRGLFFARKSDGSISVFAGTSTNLYQLNNSTFTWTNVSLSGGPYAALSATFNWQFVQFNNFVIAVQQNVVPQVFDLTSSTAFAALGGSPPQASYIAVINRFLVLSGLLSAPYRVQWSGLNATTTWDNVTSQSNFQDMADGGLARGVAGGDQYGIVFQDNAIRSMTFNPGSPEVFDFYKISSSDGIFAPYSAVNAAGQTYFIGTQGFKVVSPGGAPVPIGREKFDRTFLADVDTGNLQLCIGAADPKGPRIFWAYKSLSGQANSFDKIIVYDYVLQRATTVAMSGEYISTLSRPGLTLENLDTINSSVDALPFSLDTISTGALAQLCGVNTGHMAGFYNGSNLQATLQTAEQGDDVRRMRIRGLRPITDASAALGSVAYRETLQANPTIGTGVAMNGSGVCPMNISTRFARGQIVIPYGANWSFATGISPQITLEGER